MLNVKRIEKDFNPKWDYVIEMASIGRPILNKTSYYIALHGTDAGDRQRPHIYVYLDGDKRPFSKFNFEIALDEILCYDEINLITMRDKSKNVDLKNRNKCKGMKIQDKFRSYFSEDDINKYIECFDN